MKAEKRGAIAFVRWLDDVGFRDAVEALIGKRCAPVRQSKSDNVTLAHNSTDHCRGSSVRSRFWRRAEYDASPECVSIFADADADQQGERNAARLAAALNARGTFAEVLPSAGARS